MSSLKLISKYSAPSHFLQLQSMPIDITTLTPVRACVAPVCDFKSEVEVVTHNESFKSYWGNLKEGAY